MFKTLQILTLIFSVFSIHSVISINLNQSVLFNKFGYSINSVLIDLTSKSIETIDVLTFNGLKKLRFLYLEDNKIKLLQDNIFKDLINLKELWLEDNNILAVDKNVFNGLNNLEIVCFKNNPISNLYPSLILSLCDSNSKCIIKTTEKCFNKTEITTPIISSTKIIPSTQNPINYWSFNGNLNDSIGEANIINGVNYSLVRDRFNKSNSAISLNAGYLQLPQGIYFNGDFTFTCWVYFRKYGIWPRIFDFGNGHPDSNVLLAINTTRKLIGAVYNGKNLGSIESPNVFELNKWQHVSFVNHNSFAYLYINGQLVVGGASQVAQNVVRTANYFGRSNWYGIGTDTHTDGIFDEIKIFNVGMTAQEIFNLYISQI